MLFRRRSVFILSPLFFGRRLFWRFSLSGTGKHSGLVIEWVIRTRVWKVTDSFSEWKLKVSRLCKLPMRSMLGVCVFVSNSDEWCKCHKWQRLNTDTGVVHCLEWRSHLQIKVKLMKVFGSFDLINSHPRLAHFLKDVWNSHWC